MHMHYTSSPLIIDVLAWLIIRQQLFRSALDKLLSNIIWLHEAQLFRLAMAMAVASAGQSREFEYLLRP